MNKKQTNEKLDESIEWGETEIEKMLICLEQFAASVKKSKLKPTILHTLIAKQLGIKKTDFDNLMSKVTTGQLRRALFK